MTILLSTILLTTILTILSSATLQSSFPTSQTGTCGPLSNSTCLDSATGSCCSSYNWCGNTTSHCLLSQGCQPSYGSCTPPNPERCPCGYIADGRAYTESVEMDFRTSSREEMAEGWIVQEYRVPAGGSALYGKVFERGNVRMGDEGLEMVVKPAEGRDIAGSEVVSRRRDILYGSFRVSMRTSSVGGTCAAFFFYHNNESEIDIELLSKQSHPNAFAHFVLHSTLPLPQSQRWQQEALSFDPTDGFHEYRFDWKPGSVDFYIDGELQRTMDKGVPSEAGALFLNHWSNGDRGWSGGPPVQEAGLVVKKVEGYFGSGDEVRKREAERRCENAGGVDVVGNVCFV